LSGKKDDKTKTIVEAREGVTICKSCIEDIPYKLRITAVIPKDISNAGIGINMQFVHKKCLKEQQKKKRSDRHYG
jgi:hypothetical protein